MLAKLLLQKEFYIIQVKPIKLVKFMMELRPWTGWNKNKKEELQLHLQQLSHQQDHFGNPKKMIWVDIEPDEEMTADRTAVTQIPTHTYTPTPNDSDYRIDQKGGIMWLYLDQHLILRSILFHHPRRNVLKCASTVLSSEGLRGRVLTLQKDATSSGAKYVTMQTRTCSLVMNNERSATTNRMNVGLQFGFKIFDANSAKLLF